MSEWVGVCRPDRRAGSGGGYGAERAAHRLHRGRHLQSAPPASPAVPDLVMQHGSVIFVVSFATRANAVQGIML